MKNNEKRYKKNIDNIFDVKLAVTYPVNVKLTSNLFLE